MHYVFAQDLYKWSKLLSIYSFIGHAICRRQHFMGFLLIFQLLSSSSTFSTVFSRSLCSGCPDLKDLCSHSVPVFWYVTTLCISYCILKRDFSLAKAYNSVSLRLYWKDSIVKYLFILTLVSSSLGPVTSSSIEFFQDFSTFYVFLLMKNPI